jgi:hypothetical protein
VSRRFGPLSKFYALSLLASAAFLLASLAVNTIELRRHPSIPNLVIFIIVVVSHFYGLYVVVWAWPKLVVPSGTARQHSR